MALLKVRAGRVPVFGAWDIDADFMVTGVVGIFGLFVALLVLPVLVFDTDSMSSFRFFAGVERPDQSTRPADSSTHHTLDKYSH
jgi:hypothetical protein